MKLISDVDDVGSGTIGLEEFFKTMTHKILYRDPKGVILKALRLLDDDETGKISFMNFKLISDVDVDGSGTVGFAQFLKITTHQILNRDPTDVILKAFCLLDDNGTGKISFKNFKLSSDLDDVGSGTFGLEEFFKLITHRSWTAAQRMRSSRNPASWMMT